MQYEFTDKTSYLAWRQNWREKYRELSTEIRRLKRGRKHFLRSYEWSLSNHWNHPVRTFLAKFPNPEYTNTDKLPALRLAAAHQMEILIEAKTLSWQMRLAAKAQDTA